MNWHVDYVRLTFALKTRMVSIIKLLNMVSLDTKDNVFSKFIDVHEKGHKISCLNCNQNY